MKYYKYILLITIILAMHACSKKDSKDLGNGYRFDYDPVIRSDYAIFGPVENVYAVTGDVIKYNFDSIFIIAEQKPRESILKDFYHKPEITQKALEKILKESPIRQYWIINKTNDSIYGPFKKDEYLLKREELNIPEELVMKEE